MIASLQARSAGILVELFNEVLNKSRWDDILLKYEA
jgi:hypothetical protein